MPAGSAQMLANAVLLIDGLRTELGHDIALVDSHVGEVRAQLA